MSETKTRVTWSEQRCIAAWTLFRLEELSTAGLIELPEGLQERLERWRPMIEPVKNALIGFKPTREQVAKVLDDFGLCENTEVAIRKMFGTR